MIRYRNPQRVPFYYVSWNRGRKSMMSQINDFQCSFYHQPIKRKLTDINACKSKYSEKSSWPRFFNTMLKDCLFLFLVSRHHAFTLPLMEEINLSLDLQNNLDCRQTSDIKTYAVMNSKIFLERSTSKNDN